LVGECFSKRDLIVREWLHDRALKQQNTDRRAFALQRHAEQSAYIARPGSVRQP
jgi:hypothetical protein